MSSEDNDLWEIMEIEEFMKGDYNLCILRKDSIYAKVHKFFHRVKIDFEIVKLPITIDDLSLPLPCVLTKNCLLALVGNKDKCRRIADIIREPPMREEEPEKVVEDNNSLFGDAPKPLPITENPNLGSIMLSEESEMKIIEKTRGGCPIYDKVVERILHEFKDIDSLFKGNATAIISGIISEIQPRGHNRAYSKLSIATLDSYSCAYRRYIARANLLPTTKKNDRNQSIDLSPKPIKWTAEIGLSTDDMELLNTLPIDDIKITSAIRRKLSGFEKMKIVKCAKIDCNTENERFVWELAEQFASYYKNE